MSKYRFTGDSEEVFPSLGVGVLQPGDEVELDTDPNHPRLERVSPKSDKPDTKKEGD
jgi:hypothetical protein